MKTLHELTASWLSEGDTLTEKINTFFLHFDQEYSWRVKQVGLYPTLREYLAGLPSWIDIPFSNYDILTLSKENDLFPHYSEDDILERWFDNVAYALKDIQIFCNSRPTIASIANNNDGYYFSRKTLKFFGQRRSDFRIRKTNNPDVYQTYAIYRVPETNETGESIAYWEKTPNCKWKKVNR